jgi:hypothetical protein
LAVASLSEIGPLRASIAQAMTSERLAVVAAVVLLPVVLWALRSPPSDPPPSTRTATLRRPVAPPVPSTPGPREAAPSVVSAPEIQGSSTPLRRRPEATPEPPPDPIVRESTAPDRSRPEATTARPPPRETSVAGLPQAPPVEEHRPADPEPLIRQTILDPFGSLVLEGASGRVPIQATSVVPVDGRLTAIGRPSGFRLADGTRMQLAAGSAVSVFHHALRRCSGVTLHQGALLVDAVAAQPLFLRREKAAGLLEGFTGAIHLSAGAKPDALSLMAIGSGGVWRRSDQSAVEIASGDQLQVDAEGQDLARRGSKPKPPLARFVSWPEPTTLFYASFETDVQAGERPLVVQGTAREGFVSAVVNPQRRKVIELSVPSALLSSPDAVVRLRFRTTAARIQCNASRSLQTVPVRGRSETAWTTLTFPLGGGDGDGHYGGGRSKRDRRSTLTISVEPPPRIAVEDLVFDVDEIELLRS